MPLQTRGSAELDKAQRRLAGLKSINPNLDLGYGLTIDFYSEQIETLRAALEKHNQMVAELDASRKTLDELDRAMANLSGRMLSAVKIKYGSNSKEYSQAGGTIRKGTIPTPSFPADNAEMLMTIAPKIPSNGNGRKATTA
ncbi:hypothetical protein [Leptolyngbya sp. FACHB-17]|uniref:hypothetical protein n=1 Tax=unclassified Leptolyngbya TaxID=2650499 RepID=UPI00168027ED|nr:hypothetical protein [Leptolyngbya sp. FACHB-17]MBD2079970.1 hypothetical protein [Leptolyngbya sp. FACHB-17]